MKFIPLLTLSCLIAHPALAEDSLRIAVVDLEAVFASHPTTADATETLTRAREASRDEFKDRSNSLKEVLQQHQELIRAGRKDEAAEKLKEANEAEKRIATLRTTVLRDLEEEFRRSKQLIMTEIKAAVAEFNSDGQYALVLDRSSKSSNGLPQVVHAPGAEDITEQVIEFIKKQEAEKSDEP